MKALLLALLLLISLEATPTDKNPHTKDASAVRVKQPSYAKINSKAMAIYLKAEQTKDAKVSKRLFKKANRLWIRAFKKGSCEAGENIAHMAIRAYPPYVHSFHSHLYLALKRVHANVQDLDRMHAEKDAKERMETALYYLVVGMQRGCYKSAQMIADLLDQGFLFETNKMYVAFYRAVSAGLKEGQKPSSYGVDDYIDKHNLFDRQAIKTHREPIDDFLMFTDTSISSCGRYKPCKYFVYNAHNETKTHTKKRATKHKSHHTHHKRSKHPHRW